MIEQRVPSLQKKHALVLADLGIQVSSLELLTEAILTSGEGFRVEKSMAKDIMVSIDVMKEKDAERKFE